MTRRIALLTNPAARKGRSHSTTEAALSQLRAAGVEIIDASGSSAEQAAANARDALANVEALVVSGGDGTVALGAQLVAHTDIPLGIIASGSGNDFARTMGLIPGNPTDAVRHILAGLDHGATPVDTITLTTASSPIPVTVLGNVNMGFDARVNVSANRARGGYSLAVLRNISALTDIDYTVRIDHGDPEPLRASLLTLCNSGVFGSGMRFSPNSNPSDGILELATVSGLSRSRLARVFPQVFRGTHTGLENFSARPCTSVWIDCSDRDLEVCSDGEIWGRFPVEAALSPGAVRILM